MLLGMMVEAVDGYGDPSKKESVADPSGNLSEKLQLGPCAGMINLNERISAVKGTYSIISVGGWPRSI